MASTTDNLKPSRTMRNWPAMRKGQVQELLESRGLLAAGQKPPSVTRMSAILTLWEYELDDDDELIPEVETWWKMQKTGVIDAAKRMGVDTSGTIATLIGNMVAAIKKGEAAVPQQSTRGTFKVSTYPKCF